MPGKCSNFSADTVHNLLLNSLSTANMLNKHNLTEAQWILHCMLVCQSTQIYLSLIIILICSAVQIINKSTFTSNFLNYDK